MDPLIRRLERDPTGEGPLNGLRFAVKDLFDIAGEVSGFGSPDWLRTHGPAAVDCPVVTQLLAAGSRLVGITHMEELAFSLSGENAHYGTPANPVAPERIPGGSSSGSAAAVAAGLVDFALGTDTGGSVRVPASHCGVIGIRTTHGAIDMSGVIPLSRSFDTVGWFARDLPTMTKVAQVLLPQSSTALSVQLTAVDAFEPADWPDWQMTVNDLQSAFPRHGAIRLGEDELREWAGAFRVLQGAEAWAEHGAWIESACPALGPPIRRRFDYARSVTPEQVAAARRIREYARTRVLDLVRDGAVLCIPSAAGPAPLLGRQESATEAFRERTMMLTCIAGLSGAPQLSIPIALVDGAPVGLSLIGAPGSDRALLLAAARMLDRPSTGNQPGTA